ncbi:PEP-CTERM sorting domain-containing protein [Verrucomicrobiaceae bacterium N1E253]|uniref:PEP-CTERM sorting domain-containing protein n=1 Tax=Oceaniferula marina TaxID=2748318 RepID=A0A851GM79_9BACT|nr:PEP-CTERM sorting domain-containing protein [Oceaniferula marina]NWK55234.1 PEP-CTERM sorting domain-containing protein [Oceaniferula marina]
MKKQSFSAGALLLTGGLLCSGISAQAASVVVSENFDGLTGSGYNPGTSIDGQGGWVKNLGSVNVRNDFTTGSFDGNVAYSKNSSGHAYRHDGNAYLTSATTTLTFELSARIGTRFSRAGLAYFDGTSINPGFYFGAGREKGWAVYLGSGTGGGIEIASSTDGYYTADGVDLRLTIDLTNETGTFEYKDSGGTWQTPTGMTDFDFSALDTNASDGKNPLNWDSLYIRNALSGDTVDNLSFTAVPEPSSATLLGLSGLALVLRRKR